MFTEENVYLKNMERMVKGFYPILDVSYTPDYPAYQLAEDILSSGVGWLQLRQKNLSEGDFLKLAQKISYLKIHNSFQFIINHFVDVALKIGADGVHLGATSLSINSARKIMGDKAIIGASVHSLEEGIQKEEEGADYLTFGAIYPTATKEGGHPIQGLEKLKELCEKVSIPVIAVGGMTPERVKAVLKTGAAGFSVITAISRSPKPAEISREFWQLSQK